MQSCVQHSQSEIKAGARTKERFEVSHNHHKTIRVKDDFRSKGFKIGNALAVIQKMQAVATVLGS
jgi:hypothetical protein